MLLTGKKLARLAFTAAAAAAALLAGLATPLAGAAEPLASLGADMALESASADARYARRWVLALGDNQGQPFVIVDKKSARLFVFEASGQLRGASPALLGLTPGDRAVAGIEQREVTSLRGDERSTPAGRFVSEPGHNLQGEPIVWIDYAAKLAIHRLRPAPAHERRPERLASATPDDNRISLGCVVVPVSFFESVVAPALGKSYGVVYVLPEDQPVERMLGALQLSQH